MNHISKVGDIMGEYAIRKCDNVEISVGLCECLSRIQYEDRFKVSHKEGNRDCSKVQDCFWRLPFPDEDDAPIGEYTERANQWDSFRWYPLSGFVLEELPNKTLSLHSIKNDSLRGLKAVVISNETEKMWSVPIEDILPYISDAELNARIEKYAEEKQE
jgi:hypothetical protein